MAGVITASEPSWIAPFTGLSPRQFNKLITVLRREGATLVAGAPIFEHGQDTGARPGRLVRNGRKPAVPPNRHPGECRDPSASRESG